MARWASSTAVSKPNDLSMTYAKMQSTTKLLIVQGDYIQKIMGRRY